MDYSKCIICQTETREPLRCPSNDNKYGGTEEIYKNFVKTARCFHELQNLPVKLDVDSFNEKDLNQRKAKWHHSCKLKFSESKLNRARKRSITESVSDFEVQSSPIMTRRSRTSESQDAVDGNTVCLFCNNSSTISNPLHDVQKKELSTRIIKYITELSDSELLPKVVGGHDLIVNESKYHLKCLSQIIYSQI